MVNSKHVATFILGALAGLAAGKYASMSPEEREKMMTNLKEKANNFKDEAVKATDQAKDYFSELSKKGIDVVKEQFPGAEKWMHDIFGTKEGEATAEAGETINVEPQKEESGA